jgi:alpha-beta hydrolase superfamily lysophospholipase
MANFYRIVVSLMMLSIYSVTSASDCVILLHGLARTSASMEKLASALTSEGFQVANTAYPSRDHTIEQLSKVAIESGLSACAPGATVHFVTHSLGGILVRYYMENYTENNDLEGLGRVVMLAPPNQGSGVVDVLRDLSVFEFVNGLAGLQLGTDPDSIPSRLGAVEFELGVIAGSRSLNPILSQFLPNPDDGKVSVESTRVEGMADFITVSHSHPFIMQASDVIQQTIHFIRNGKFSHEPR